MSTVAGGLVEREADRWTVRGHSAAVQALRDPHLIVPQAGPSYQDGRGTPSVAEFFRMWFTVTGEHGPVKAGLAGPFSARRIDQFADGLARLARERVDRLPGDGDLVADCLTPYAIDCAIVLAGIPATETRRLVAVTRLLTAAFHGAVKDADEPLRQSIRYLRAVTDRIRTADHPTPLAAALRELAARGGEWTATAVLAQILTAGVEPTVTGTALAYRALLRDPGLPQRVPPERIADEALRCTPPFPRVHRVAADACDCLGARIEAGEPVLIDIVAANHDPDVFGDGGFDPTRPVPGLTFGLGAYHCLGVAFARRQITTMLGALARLDARVDPEALVLRRGPHTVVATALPFHRVAGAPRG